MLQDLLLNLKPWLVWLHLNPYWVGIAAFLIAFVECLAVIGLLVPGSVFMTALGALIGSHVVTAKMIFIPSMVGAILGDTISYFIGHYYREHLRDIWPFKFYPRLLQQGESFFYRHGGKGIFIAKFIGPIRPVLPIIAGMLYMSPWRFLISDSISAVIWAPIYMLPGILLGAASMQLAPDIALHLMFYVIAALLGLWCVSWLNKRIIAWIFKTFHNLLDELWLAIKDKPFLHPLHVALQDPLHPESHAQLTLALYFLLITGLFSALTVHIIFHLSGTLLSWNESMLFILRSIRNPAADNIFLTITLAAQPVVWLGIFFVLLAWFLAIKAFRTAGHWLLLGGLAFGVTEIFKHFIHSPRPWGILVQPAGYSFPSGHTTISGVLIGFLAVLIAREIKKPHRWIPYTIAVLYVIIVGISRLYLGAHWITDILGSILFALASIMLVTLSYRRQQTPKLNPYLLTAVFVASWGAIASVYGLKHFEQMKHDYSVYLPARVLSIEDWWTHDGIDEPLYRLNRMGKPAQVLNLQLAGNLNDLQKNLMAQGWRPLPNTTLGLLIVHMSKQPKKVEPPVLPPLFQDQRPALLMTKNTNSPYSILVLTLWDSRTRFNDTRIPLWIGNISYYHIWQTGFFHLHPEKVILPPVSAIQILYQNINPDLWQWKLLSYPISSRNLKFEKIEWDGQLLLVQPKNDEVS